MSALPEETETDPLPKMRAFDPIMTIYNQTGMAGRAVPKAEQPLTEPEPAIPRALAEQGKIMSELRGLLDTLSDRLVAVSKPQPQAPIKDAPECPQPIRVTVCDGIAHNNNAIVAACGRIQDMIRNLDV